MLSYPPRAPMIVKSGREVSAMRPACQAAAETLLAVSDIIRPGVTGLDIDKLVQEDTKRRGGVCAPYGYRGYSKSVCVSINDCVCHGVPDGRKLKDGDIVNVDVTTIIDGWHGDTSATFYVGTRSGDAVRVVEGARAALEAGIAEVRHGARLGDVGAAIQELAESRGLSTVRVFYGHGIGRGFHEAPNVPHFGTRGLGLRLQRGMCLTVEPMLCTGSHDIVIRDDGWTAMTADGGLSAQFEHTLLVTDDGCDILTRRSRPLRNSEP